MIERYAQMIQAALSGRTAWRVAETRKVDALVAAYWDAAQRAPDIGGLAGNVLPVDQTPKAADGERVATSAWSALALHAAGERTDLARETMQSLAATQRPDGAFFLAGRQDNLETLWYWELVLLHAVAAYGLSAGSPPLLAAARRASLYHLHETQPDHATSEPWGLNAFLLDPETWPLADQVLHSVTVQHPTGVVGVSGILLADTLRSLPRR
jgi:hypothetical protein